ncbi:hypothetical protein [Sulfitobacter guttiformis]|uniref:Uncharacterized protein n=1 Tax=Sulfitobacter guttiformis TaxID=74349 RepID=A0A420DU82_9RHOB|nr:hypothetical protein [Sulfitobacter guttiformis]KIN71287.1 hypothetical protein Z949_446 [Sulfitobacter guttiformis KCTC 32187]RKE97743.1 hypothetical protein C8N30_2368 [Sulfitobacter guttiformis]
MIPKTPPFAWTAKAYIAIASVLLAVVFGLGVALSPSRTPTVAVIGDRADEVRTALGIAQSDDATVTIVLLNRWDSLRHLPDIAELCWDACHFGAAAQIALTQMRFSKTRKVVVFHLPDFENDLACVVERARFEAQALRAAFPACKTNAARLAVWILPMGLGRIS